MYRLFDESGISLDDCSGVVDCFEDGANCIKNVQQQDQQLQSHNGTVVTSVTTSLITNTITNVQQQAQFTEMVAQENPAAQSYNELLQQQQNTNNQDEPQEFISLEELRPCVDSSRMPSIAATSSNQIYHHHHHHHHHHHQRHQQTYYNLTPAQESPCSVVYFGELEATGATTVGSAGGLGDQPADSSSRATSTTITTNETTTTTITTKNTDIIAPAPSAGLIVASEAPASTASSTSSNLSLTGNIDNNSHKEQYHHHNNNHSNNHNNRQQRRQHMETSNTGPTAMIPEQQQEQQQQQQQQTRGGNGGRHYHHHHHHHHRRSSQTNQNVINDSGSIDEMQHQSKKRKVFCHDGSDLMDDQGDDAKSVRSNDDSKKQNHSEIEKRRRDKMNTYITELSAIIPMCHAMSRKLDKLTVLRMAVQHLKTILGAVTSYTEGHYKPAFLSDQELKTLILQAAEGFVFVVGCDRGRILYVSKSVSQTLNYSQGDLLGQSWFDILHPKDVAKVKEQLSSSDLSPRERLIDAKTMLPVKTDVPQGVSRLCPGARRSFFCRMKRKVDARYAESQIKEEADTTTGCHRRKKQQNHDWKYCVIQCTGYLKSWAPAKIGLEEQEAEADGEACNLSCLVAVGRIQAPLVAPSTTPQRLRLRTIEFVSRHAMDGKFLFVDQRATLVLGFLPQELLGTSMYEYYHHDDIPHLAESHKAALQSSERVTTQVYRFRSKGASFVRLCSEWKSFRNPWTKDIEYLIAKNSAVFSDTRQVESSANRSEGGSVQENYDYFAQSNGGLERLISSHVEVSKIGRQIAEEVLDLQRRSDQDSSSGSSPTPGPEPALLNPESQITTTASPEHASEIRQCAYSQMDNNVQLNIIASDQGPPGEEEMMEIIGGTTINESPNPVPSDGNDEAAMAVIMSLLEADAGLGGPVDFSGLPWPLP